MYKSAGQNLIGSNTKSIVNAKTNEVNNERSGPCSLMRFSLANIEHDVIEGSYVTQNVPSGAYCL